MKLLFALLVAAAAVVGCRHHRDGRPANDPSAASLADGGANEPAPLSAPQGPDAPAPPVTAQPGDVQL